MTDQIDLIDVVERATLIENILNQVIEGFCEPRKDPFMFFWNVILDSSVMPLGSKVKVASAIAHQLDFNLERESLHKIMALRNAFAHHGLGSHPVLVVGKTEKDCYGYNELQVLSNAGNVSRMRREDALSDFNDAFKVAKRSLFALNAVIKQHRQSDG